MYLVGLTGGIAAGKSTVASLWESLGATIIDADDLARQAVAPGTAGFAEVATRFPDAIDREGNLDRKKLGQLVFNDESARKSLEGIIHPIVRALAQEAVARAKTDVVVYVVPLLVEAGVDLPFDLVVTVEAPADEQIKRMVKHRKMTEVEARSRIAAQTNAAMRANHADVILNSNQSIDLLNRDARELFETISRRAK